MSAAGIAAKPKAVVWTPTSAGDVRTYYIYLPLVQSRRNTRTGEANDPRSTRRQT